MKRCFALVGTAGLILLLAGCGEGEPPTYNVHGEVTFDGKPLPDGKISFNSEKPGEIPATLPITNGSYEGSVKEGTYRVEIRAYRKGEPLPPDTAGADPEPPLENYIPAKYNSQSTEKVKVTPDGPNKFDFKLTK